MDYDILRCGAVADGVTNCAAAIQQAVDAAAAAGGGRVVVPAGRFLSGSVTAEGQRGAASGKRRCAYQQPEPRRHRAVPPGRGRHRPR